MRFDDDTTLSVRGNLTAEGTSAATILFHPEVTLGRWRGISVRGDLGATASLKWATLYFADTAFEVVGPGTFAIENSTFWANNKGVSMGGSASIYRCVFERNGTGIEGSASVSESTFRRNATGMISGSAVLSVFENNTKGAEGVSATQCVFRGNTVGLLGVAYDSMFTNNNVGAQNSSATDSEFIDNGTGLTTGGGGVTGCFFSGNTLALDAGSADVRRSVFTNNTTAVRLGNGPDFVLNRVAENSDGIILLGTRKVNFNNIVGNTGYGIRTTVVENQDATQNWWSGSGAFIDSTIYDGYDDASVGLVLYDPALSAAVEIPPMETTTTTTTPATTTTSTTFPPSGTAYVPPNFDVLNCEAGAARAAAKLFSALAACHKRVAAGILKGKPFDGESCALRAYAKYDVMTLNLRNCPPCLSHASREDIKDVLVAMDVYLKPQFYCSGVDPLP